MYNYTLIFINLLYRITIISATLSILNKQKLLTNTFIFNVISTSSVFLLTHIINDLLKEEYDNIKRKTGYNFIPYFISPIIISILYTFRHFCTNFLCINN